MININQIVTIHTHAHRQTDRQTDRERERANILVVNFKIL